MSYFSRQLFHFFAKQELRDDFDQFQTQPKISTIKLLKKKKNYFMKLA